MAGEFDNHDERFIRVYHDKKDHLKVHFLPQTKTVYDEDGNRSRVPAPGIVRFVTPRGNLEFSADEFDELVDKVNELYEEYETSEDEG